MSADVTTIVVSYNTKDSLRRCLQCLADAGPVIVVDNASHDGSADMVTTEFPQVTLIRNAGNRGFGAANNQGIDIATTPWVLCLNSDAYAEPGAVAALAQCAVEHGAAAAGGRLLNPDGSLQESVAKRLTLWHVFLEQSLLEPLLRGFNLGYWTTEAVLKRGGGAVTQVMGACLLLRKDLSERFDERFFLYCEDTELCARLAKHGSIVYCPDAVFTHELGTSSSDNRWLSVARYNRGKELYFAIHEPWKQLPCFVLNRAGALLRLVGWMFLSIASPHNRPKVRLFWHVLSSPLDPDASPRSMPRE